MVSEEKIREQSQFFGDDSMNENWVKHKGICQAWFPQTAEQLRDMYKEQGVDDYE